MAKNGRERNGTVSDATLRKSIEFQRIANRAAHKAQDENRRLGISNWYSIGGKIVSDQEVSDYVSAKNSTEHENDFPQD